MIAFLIFTMGAALAWSAENRPAAQSPAATKETALSKPSARSVDIVGIRSGMNPDEAIEVLRKRLPAMRLERFRVAVSAPLSMDFIGYLDAKHFTHFRDKDELFPDGGEAVRLTLSPPPGEQRIIAIAKVEFFPSGEEPLIGDLLAALREKYGPPDKESRTLGPVLHWFFDLSRPDEECYGFGAALPGRVAQPLFQRPIREVPAAYHFALKRETEDTERDRYMGMLQTSRSGRYRDLPGGAWGHQCGRVLTVSITPAPTNSALLQRVDMWYADFPMSHAAVTKTHSLMVKAQEEAKQKALDEAKGRKKPSL